MVFVAGVRSRCSELVSVYRGVRHLAAVAVTAAAGAATCMRNVRLNLLVLIIHTR